MMEVLSEGSIGARNFQDADHLHTPVYRQTNSVHLQPAINIPSEFTNITEKDRLLANSHYKPSELHLNTDESYQTKQSGDRTRSKPDIISFQPQSRQSIGLLSYNRLVIPTKADIAAGSASDMEPLVIIEMDDSEEEEFVQPGLRTFPKQEITRQLMEDGYNLDLQPDDNDLDLILPKSNKNRCDCCSQFGCGIQ